jgi:hypothetical protein
MRLSARLHAARLDRELATGASPDSSAALSLRAQTLIGSSARAKLASYIERLVDEHGKPLVPLAPGLCISRRTVHASRGALLELAQRLVREEPIAARGVAYTLVLLTATDGPAYDSREPDRFEPALRAAIAALEPDAWAACAGDEHWRGWEEERA